MTRPIFRDWLAEQLGTRKWVVSHRTTPRLAAKYEIVLTHKRFKALQAKFGTEQA